MEQTETIDNGIVRLQQREVVVSSIICGFGTAEMRSNRES